MLNAQFTSNQANKNVTRNEIQHRFVLQITNPRRWIRYIYYRNTAQCRIYYTTRLS